ncbi:calcium-binding protein [Microvirga sp. G4-2]|uniref:calcium-binding protein n=1 Tax=Microvirga sp. G4-2 TaxID=3434467 RepID=UPI004043B05D
MESTGLVSGSTGIFVSGDNATINNKGLIQGNTGLQLSGGINVVENSGTIWGSGSGISSLGGSLTLLNRGEVFGGGLVIEGSNQRDVITNLGSIRGNYLLLNDGDDLYDGTGGYCSSLIWLGRGDDIALGGNGSERFYGGDGNDYIDGGAGIDTLEYIGTAPLTVDLRIKGPQNTGEGWDTLVNIENIDMRKTGVTADRLTGSEIANQLYGGSGDDTLEGGLGDDLLDGGAGDDTARYSGSAAAIVSLALQGQRQNTGGYGFDTLIGIDHLEGGSGADQLTGNGEDNRLSGNAGNDVLVQKENDGNDVMSGGSGIDTVSFSGTAGATINLALTSAQITAYGTDTLTGIENLSGGSGNDRFTGNTLANILKGNSGNDTLDGGYGKDVLYGGSGKDIFVFTTKPSSSNYDKIADYNWSDDTIYLENGVFTKLGSGSITSPKKLASSAFWTGAMAHDSSDRIIYDSAKGYLYYDADGTGAAKQVLIATMAKGHNMTYAEFYVI